MAEDPKAVAAPDPAAAPRQEEDALFKLQVGASEFLLKHVRTFVWIVVAGLGVALVYSLVVEWRTRAAKEGFGAIADIDYKMPPVDQMALYGLAPMDDPADTARMANVEEGARRYRAAAEDASGSAAVFARLRAADTWKRAGKPDEALVDLEAAWNLKQSDLPGFAAASRYATALAGKDRLEEAIGVLREEATREQGLYAEEALIALAQLQVDAGKPGEAQHVIDEFRTRFPDSPRVTRLLTVMAAAGLTPAPAPAPSAPATP